MLPIVSCLEINGITEFELKYTISVNMMSAYHVGKINKWIVDRDDLNSFFQSNTHNEATNAAKSSTHQTNGNRYTLMFTFAICRRLFVCLL